jgi:sarcosine oxidase subunit beta
MHAPVIGIDVERGRVTGVRTTRGRIATPSVINAAGAGAMEVAAMAGLRMGARAATYQAMITERVPPIFPVMFGVASATIYWRQTVSGNLLFGGPPPGAPRDESPRTAVDWS